MAFPLIFRRHARRLLARLGILRPVPSRDHGNQIGLGDFEAVGEEFLRYFVEFAGLTPHDRVLDVGCGLGRMAVPLTRYLSRKGRYHGFDIVAEHIDWCQSRITPRFPHFRFLHADVFNTSYNPAGRYLPREYSFPYPDGAFDLAVLTSVFTHMLPADVGHYLAEIARVLKPGGRCLATFFLLNAEARELIASGRGQMAFAYPADGYRTVNPDRPEDAVAFEEQSVREMFRRGGLEVREPVRYGSWCGRGTFVSFQDIVIGVKPPAAAG
ncbi:MAG TPA: class I SAM-dependent methyltransferase [Gemmataceae bacterium]